jgi:hypothetical protein
VVALSAWQSSSSGRAMAPLGLPLARGAGYMPASPNSLTHGRDLAQSTGQPAERPEAPAEQELAFAPTQFPTIPPTGQFSPAQTDADDAPAIDRPSPSSALCQLGSTS